ncbi:hypothetical protein F4561_005196 [Lipingzhangella halophila]|uniref:Uncharacterized protein n=1 Tax=Lipingzhangella halophila TaxID=1783352 RepID=A0A7W7RMV8_9ACTN|nr:hypothetical protein [Lipingzhangella halophila]
MEHELTTQPGIHEHDPGTVATALGPPTYVEGPSGSGP